MEQQTNSETGTQSAAPTVGRASYWSSFYASESPSGLQPPSQFAAFVAQECEPGSAIFDVGCGSGRDSLFFAALGFKVVALDRSQEAIDAATKRAQESAVENVRFVCGDIAGQSFTEALDGLGAKTACLYARFFLHAITEVEQAQFFEKLGERLKQGHKVAVEYRTSQDQFLEKVAPPHFRRYQEAKDVNAFLEGCGFRLLYQKEGQGFAKYKEEDAIVARAIFEKT